MGVSKVKNLVIENKKTGCWEWQAGKANFGYGKIMVKNEKSRRAHRFMYKLFFGNFPKDKKVLHKCDNPPCVNPAHLFLGSLQDNANDMSKKGRGFHQKKTHCPNGHPYSGKNLIYESGYDRTGKRQSNPKRRCKKCRIAASRRYEKRKARLDQPI